MNLWTIPSAEGAITYAVLLTRKKQKFIARVRQWPAIVVEGDTEEEALRKAQADLQALLVGGRIIQLDLEAKREGHPWQQFAGMSADDPDWDTFHASLQQYREDIDRTSAEE
jgi:predicted RNase H-like HicB family nuclease